MSGLPPAFLFGIVLLVLAGCGNGNAKPDAREVHAIHVEMRPAELILMPAPDGALSPADGQRVKDFIDAWRDRGRGPLRVAVPARLGPRAQDRLLGDLKGLVKRRGCRGRHAGGGIQRRCRSIHRLRRFRRGRSGLRG
jgi:type IV pilus biogenesis protein CpaD/CtpE